MAVIKSAMSYTQLCSKHVLKFFGGDGRDKGLRFSQDEFLISLSLSLSVVFCHFSFLSFPSFFSVHFSVLLSLSLLPGLYDYLSLLRSLFVSVVPWLLLFAAVSDSKTSRFC